MGNGNYQLKVDSNSKLTIQIRASSAADLSFQGHIAIPNRIPPPPYKGIVKLWNGGQQKLKKSLLFRDTLDSGSSVQWGGGLSMSLMLSNPVEKADPNYKFQTIIDLRSGNNGLHAIETYYKWDMNDWKLFSVEFT